MRDRNDDGFLLVYPVKDSVRKPPRTSAPDAFLHNLTTFGPFRDALHNHLNLCAEFLSQADLLRLVITNGFTQVCPCLFEESNIHDCSNSAKTSSAGIASVSPASKAAQRLLISSSQSASTRGSGGSRLVSKASASWARTFGGSASASSKICCVAVDVGDLACRDDRPSTLKLKFQRITFADSCGVDL